MRSQIHQEFFQFLSEGLKETNYFHSITLHFSEIKDHGITYLGEALEYAKCSHTLHFEDSKIDDAEVEFLANGLKKTKFPHEILFFSCGISHVGVKFISDALQSTSCSHSISLSGAEIGDKGAIQLAEVFKHAQCFQKISLKYETIKGIHGEKYLSEGLENATHSHSLCIFIQNTVDKEKLQHLSNSLIKAKRSHVVEVGGQIGCQSIAYLANMFKNKETQCSHAVSICDAKLSFEAEKNLLNSIQSSNHSHKVKIYLSKTAMEYCIELLKNKEFPAGMYIMPYEASENKELVNEINRLMFNHQVIAYFVFLQCARNTLTVDAANKIAAFIFGSEFIEKNFTQKTWNKINYRYKTPVSQQIDAVGLVGNFKTEDKPENEILPADAPTSDVGRTAGHH